MNMGIDLNGEMRKEHDNFIDPGDDAFPFSLYLSGAIHLGYDGLRCNVSTRCIFTDEAKQIVK
jgi:hypothetical protein